MRRFLWFWTFLILFLSPSLYAVPEYPWELKKNKEDIVIHIRRVEGSPILEYKGEMTVNAGLEKVLAFYQDYKRMPEWFYQCLESKWLETKRESEEVLYFAIDMPWPVNDRDLVYQRTISKDVRTGAVEFHISAVKDPKYYPPQPGRVRMPEIRGIWRFTPMPDGRTEVYYQQHGDAGGFIPPLLINQLAVTIPFNTLRNFRDKVNSLKTE